MSSSSELSIVHSPVRKWTGYGQALVELVLTRGHHWVTKVEDVAELSQWQRFESKHLFFDIDDTLNAHRQGLTEGICRWLNTYIDQGKTVVLLTNCSKARAAQHRDRLRNYDCRAELWPVGGKPDVTWLKSSIEAKGWSSGDCAMIGDRPTMDMWMAMKAGFAERIWIKGWGFHRGYSRPLTWIQSIEWALLK